MTNRVLIAGGGITGLSAAYNLQKKARAAGVNPEILLVERDERLGGKTQTEIIDGMVIETAPDSFVTTKPWMRELCQELGLPIVPTNPKCTRTYIYHRGQMEALPVGMQMMIPTEVWPFLKTRLISPLGKLRAGMEPFVPIRRTDEDESIGSFVSRRFGREILENLAGPLMGGIYGGGYDEISLKSTFPMFLKMEREQGSLLLAAQKQKKARAAKPKGPTGFSTFMTVPTGLKDAVAALVKACDGVKFLTGTGLTKLEKRENGYVATLTNGDVVEADAVVLATPAWAASELVKPEFPEIATELDNIEYGSSVVVALGYNRADINHPLDASGFQVPIQENIELKASTWVSSKWEHAAPPDKALLRCFLGRAGGKDWTLESDEAILSAVFEGLKQTMNLTAKPTVTRIFRWRRAMAQYKVGHLDRMDYLDKLVSSKAPGLYLAGAAYRGVGLPDCVREGAGAADKISKQLGWVK